MSDKRLEDFASKVEKIKESFPDRGLELKRKKLYPKIIQEVLDTVSDFCKIAVSDSLLEKKYTAAQHIIKDAREKYMTLFDIKNNSLLRDGLAEASQLLQELYTEKQHKLHIPAEEILFLRHALPDEYQLITHGSYPLSKDYGTDLVVKNAQGHIQSLLEVYHVPQVFVAEMLKDFLQKYEELLKNNRKDQVLSISIDFFDAVEQIILDVLSNNDTDISLSQEMFSHIYNALFVGVSYHIQDLFHHSALILETPVENLQTQEQEVPKEEIQKEVPPIVLKTHVPTPEEMLEMFSDRKKSSHLTYDIQDKEAKIIVDSTLSRALSFAMSHHQAKLPSQEEHHTLERYLSKKLLEIFEEMSYDGCYLISHETMAEQDALIRQTLKNFFQNNTEKNTIWRHVIADTLHTINRALFKLPMDEAINAHEIIYSVPSKEATLKPVVEEPVVSDEKEVEEEANTAVLPTIVPKAETTNIYQGLSQEEILEEFYNKEIRSRVTYKIHKEMAAPILSDIISRALSFSIDLHAEQTPPHHKHRAIENELYVQFINLLERTASKKYYNVRQSTIVQQDDVIEFIAINFCSDSPKIWKKIFTVALRHINRALFLLPMEEKLQAHTVVYREPEVQAPLQENSIEVKKQEDTLSKEQGETILHEPQAILNMFLDTKKVSFLTYQITKEEAKAILSATVNHSISCVISMNNKTLPSREFHTRLEKYISESLLDLLEGMSTHTHYNINQTFITQQTKLVNLTISNFFHPIFVERINWKETLEWIDILRRALMMINHQLFNNTFLEDIYTHNVSYYESSQAMSLESTMEEKSLLQDTEEMIEDSTIESAQIVQESEQENIVSHTQPIDQEQNLSAQEKIEVATKFFEKGITRILSSMYEVKQAMKHISTASLIQLQEESKVVTKKYEPFLTLYQESKGSNTELKEFFSEVAGTLQKVLRTVKKSKSMHTLWQDLPADQIDDILEYMDGEDIFTQHDLHHSLLLAEEGAMKLTSINTHINDILTKIEHARKSVDSYQLQQSSIFLGEDPLTIARVFQPEAYKEMQTQNIDIWKQEIKRMENEVSSFSEIFIRPLDDKISQIYESLSVKIKIEHSESSYIKFEISTMEEMSMLLQNLTYLGSFFQKNERATPTQEEVLPTLPEVPSVPTQLPEEALPESIQNTKVDTKISTKAEKNPLIISVKELHKKHLQEKKSVQKKTSLSKKDIHELISLWGGTLDTIVKIDCYGKHEWKLLGRTESLSKIHALILHMTFLLSEYGIESSDPTEHVAKVINTLITRQQGFKEKFPVEEIKGMRASLAKCSIMELGTPVLNEAGLLAEEYKVLLQTFPLFPRGDNEELILKNLLG